MRIIASILLFILAQASVLAQELPTKVERDQMLIGEVNTIIIQHGGALKESELLSFDLLQAETASALGKTEPIEIEVYKVVYSPEEIRIQFTVWDSAQVVVPPFKLNQSGDVSSQAFMFQVGFPQVDENGDIADIYEITIDGDPVSKFNARFWWLLDVAWLLLFLIGLWLVMRIKNSLEALMDPQNQLEPDERALFDLRKLMQQKLFSGEQQKIHFAEFSDILRRYIGLRYNFITFEKTTNEIVSHLNRNRVDAKLVEQFGSLLTLADMIKFSKATTDEAEILRAYHTAEALILETTALHKTLNSQKKGEHDA